MNKAKQLDELGIDLLRAVIEQSNRSIIVDIISPFLGRLSQQALRKRLVDLEKEGLIVLDRSRSSRTIYVEATRKGRSLVSNSKNLGHEGVQVLEEA